MLPAYRIAKKRQGHIPPALQYTRERLPNTAKPRTDTAEAPGKTAESLPD